jgi:hypothetical protein
MTSLPTQDDKAETVSDLIWMGLDVSPHELLTLAETRRTDPELAMRIAAASAAQYVRGPMTELETARFIKTWVRPLSAERKEAAQ